LHCPLTQEASGHALEPSGHRMHGPAGATQTALLPLVPALLPGGGGDDPVLGPPVGGGRHSQVGQPVVGSVANRPPGQATPHAIAGHG
jgi:hypothetical protein